MELMFKDVTDRILKSFFNAYKELGFGFSKDVYENAMLVELNDLGAKSQVRRVIRVFYKELQVGEYTADIIVDDSVLLVIRAVETTSEQDEYQLINILKATGIEVGMLLNFGKKPEFKRKVFMKRRPIV